MFLAAPARKTTLTIHSRALKPGRPRTTRIPFVHASRRYAKCSQRQPRCGSPKVRGTIQEGGTAQAQLKFPIAHNLAPQTWLRGQYQDFKVGSAIKNSRHPWPCIKKNLMVRAWPLPPSSARAMGTFTVSNHRPPHNYINDDIKTAQGSLDVKRVSIFRDPAYAVPVDRGPGKSFQHFGRHRRQEIGTVTPPQELRPDQNLVGRKSAHQMKKVRRH